MISYNLKKKQQQKQMHELKLFPFLVISPSLFLFNVAKKLSQYADKNVLKLMEKVLKDNWKSHKGLIDEWRKKYMKINIVHIIKSAVMAKL